MKYVFLFLFFVLSSIRVQAQREEPLAYDYLTHDPLTRDSFKQDSLKTQLIQSKPDISRVKLLLWLGANQVFEAGEFKEDMDSARTYTRQAQQLSHKLGYAAGEAQSLSLLGTINLESRNLSQAIAYQDSAIGLFKRLHHDRGLASSYVLKGNALRDKGDYPLSRKLYLQAIDICTKARYLEQAGQAYFELGMSYAAWGQDLNQRISYIQKAIPLFEQAGNKIKQADILTYLGDLYGLQGNYAQALIELRKALALYHSFGHTNLVSVYDLLGYFSTLLGNYQDGLKYGLLAVKTAEQQPGYNLSLCTIYNRMAQTYQGLRQLDKAEVYFKKSLQIAQKFNHRPSVIILATNIANLLTIELGNPEEALKVLHHTERNYAPQGMDGKIQLTAQLLGTYTYLKKYGPAQLYCNQLLALSDTLGKNDLQQQVLYSNIIRFFLASKQHEQARMYLTKYTEFADNTHSLKSSSEIQLFWFKLDSTEANYPLAIKHYQRYKMLQDSLYDETKIKQMASLEVQFETEQKEKNLQLKEQRIQTLTNERLLQEQKSKKDHLILNFSIGGAVLLLLLLILMYNRYRLKQQSTQLLEAKQQEINLKNTSLQQVLGEKEELLVYKDALLEEKEWLLKEIHHRVKNNLQIVMSLLNSQAAHLKDGKALSAIQESQQRVHAISLIHQKLYQSEKVALIQMDSYIREVADYLKESFDDGDRIKFELAIAPVELDVAIAVPLGLIINEAITNCLKYAFPQGGKGVIGISLGPVDGMNYLLTIEDDGVGLGADFDISRTRTLGMNLIKGLSKQLKAELKVESMGGLKISLLFNNSILVKSFADQPLPS